MGSSDWEKVRNEYLGVDICGNSFYKTTCKGCAVKISHSRQFLHPFSNLKLI